jgi:23S rRNA pseudouridine1911/1915/1917 synthase
MKETFRFTVPEAEHRKRLDEFLFDRFGALSKIHLRHLALDGYVLVNGAPEKPGHRVQKDDEIEIEADLKAETAMKPQPIPLEIVFEDDEIIVVNKPAEMLVHPTLNVKSGTLLNALSYHFNESLESGIRIQRLSTLDSRLQTPDSRPFIRPGLIHRLDKKTSGLMVIAKNRRAHKILADHFQRKLVEKKYLALVEGAVEKGYGVIDAVIGYDENLRQWRVVESGKAAETRFKVLRKNFEMSLLELEPVTGRTNQLRIHCAFLGHPIIGDTERGGREFSRLCLHAYKLFFRHPDSNEPLEFKTAMPKEFAVIDAQISKG